MTKRKYRGIYTNARDCRNAINESVEQLMNMVEVTTTCHKYNSSGRFHLVTVNYCQFNCRYYEKRKERSGGNE